MGGVQPAEGGRAAGGRVPADLTPSSGLHVCFAASGQRSGSLRGLHLDFKALGGYVLIPPSQIGGRRYEVIDERPPTGRALDWDAAKRLLVPPKPYRAEAAWRGSQKHLVTWLDGEFAGNRNNGLFWACCRALEAGSRTRSATSPTRPWPLGSPPTRCARPVASARRAADDDR